MRCDHTGICSFDASRPEHPATGGPLQPRMIRFRISPPTNEGACDSLERARDQGGLWRGPKKKPGKRVTRSFVMKTGTPDIPRGVPPASPSCRPSEAGGDQETSVVSKFEESSKSASLVPDMDLRDQSFTFRDRIGELWVGSGRTSCFLGCEAKDTSTSLER